MLYNEKLINPFNESPESELPHRIEKVPNWTEHYFFWAYDGDNDFGVYLHVGRLTTSPDVWRSVFQVMLPGGEALAIKTFGRGSERGPHAGPMRLTCVQPFRLWTLDFDGAAYTTSRHALTHGIFQDGPAEVAKIHLVFEAAGPLIALDKNQLPEGMSVAKFHTNQVMSMHGTAEYRGKKLTLKGIGVRDHSDGPRDYGPVSGHIWFHALFPSGKVLFCQKVNFDGFTLNSGYIFRGDGTPMENVAPTELPYIYQKGDPDESMDCDPVTGSDREFRLILKTSKGEEVVEGEHVHTSAITYFPIMEESIGTGLGQRGGLQMLDVAAKVRCGGEDGWALRERSSRTESLRATVADQSGAKLKSASRK